MVFMRKRSWVSMASARRRERFSARARPRPRDSAMMAREAMRLTGTAVIRATATTMRKVPTLILVWNLSREMSRIQAAGLVQLKLVHQLAHRVEVLVLGRDDAL